jgi:hypothetical protein
MKIRQLSLSAIAMLAMVLCATALTSAAADEGGSATTKPSASTQGADGALKFYGAISAVDPQAKTFVVDNQTYSIVPESHMTKAADDSIATIADAVVGEPARGTYTKTSDGKLNVTKVRFGKKTGGKAGGGGKGGSGKSGGKKGAATTQASDQ